MSRRLYASSRIGTQPRASKRGGPRTIQEEEEEGRRRREEEGRKEEGRGHKAIQNEDPTPQEGWEKRKHAGFLLEARKTLETTAFRCQTPDSPC